MPGDAERTRGLEHVIVIEEAHRLLRNRGDGRASAHAVELFAGMLAEIRAYGEGIVVAEQIPTKLVPDVVKNTALKVVHRLPAYDDRRLVGAAMNLDEDQSREVVSLPPGAAAVFADGMDRPLRVRVPLGRDRERALPGPVPPIGGAAFRRVRRRVPDGRACSLYELREADLLAVAPEWAWLRVWTDTLVLAHLVDRPLPRVPDELGATWAAQPARLRECVLATVLDRAVGRRSVALRAAYAPEDAHRDRRRAARRLLGGAPGPAGSLPGAAWVIPQIRWLHEMDRLFPPRPGGPGQARPGPADGLRAAGPEGAAGAAVRPPRARAAPPSAVDGAGVQPADRPGGDPRRRRPRGFVATSRWSASASTPPTASARRRADAGAVAGGRARLARSLHRGLRGSRGALPFFDA